MEKAFLQTGQTFMAGQKMQMPWGNFATRHRLNQAIGGKTLKQSSFPRRRASRI